MVSVSIQRYIEANHIRPDLRPHPGGRVDRTPHESGWNNRFENINQITDVHLFQWHCKLYLTMFNTFLQKMFSNDLTLIKFYQELQTSFWQNSPNAAPEERIVTV